MKDTVERAIDVMRENLGEALTMDNLARAAVCSKFHFSRSFAQVTGVSPRRFLSIMRIREAQRLLAFTSLTVSEINYRVGYSSVGTFGSRFARRVGVCPGTYRGAARDHFRGAPSGVVLVPDSAVVCPVGGGSDT